MLIPACRRLSLAAGCSGPSLLSSLYPAIFGIRAKATLAFEEFVTPAGGLANGADPRTVIVLHGLLGCARNFRTFVRRLAEQTAAAEAGQAHASGEGTAGRPWRFLSLDLRCHGASKHLPGFNAPHTLDAAADDVLDFMRKELGSQQLHALVGHSLGGKIALATLDQLQRGASPDVAPPSQVWVLDSWPAKLHDAGGADGVGHVITTLEPIPLPVPSREWLQQHLAHSGFSTPMMHWLASSLVPQHKPAAGSKALDWNFDLVGAKALYDSYCASEYWHLLESPAAGTALHLVRAAQSDRWKSEGVVHRLEDAAAASASSAATSDSRPAIPQGASARLHAAGGQLQAGRFHLHLLPDAGHWLHADNPVGLKAIMVPFLSGQAS